VSSIITSHLKTELELATEKPRIIKRRTSRKQLSYLSKLASFMEQPPSQKPVTDRCPRLNEFCSCPKTTFNL